MSMIINPSTEKGKIQLETIGWMQAQMNEVLLKFFENKYRLIGGIQLEFRLGLDLNLSETIKVDVNTLEPSNKMSFDRAIESVIKSYIFDEETKNGSDKAELPNKKA